MGLFFGPACLGPYADSPDLLPLGRIKPSQGASTIFPDPAPVAENASPYPSSAYFRYHFTSIG